MCDCLIRLPWWISRIKPSQLVYMLVFYLCRDVCSALGCAAVKMGFEALFLLHWITVDVKQKFVSFTFWDQYCKVIIRADETVGISKHCRLDLLVFAMVVALGSTCWWRQIPFFYECTFLIGTCKWAHVGCSSTCSNLPLHSSVWVI